MILYKIIQAFYLSGEEKQHVGNHNKPSYRLSPEQLQKDLDFFERIEREEKERKIKDANADWNFRYKRRILRHNDLCGLEEEFVWIWYRMILFIRKYV